MNGDGRTLSLTLPPDLVEVIAQRAAEIVLERQASRGADSYLDVARAAEFLACPKSRLYALVSAKRIPYYKDGSRTLFSRRELHEWVRTGGAKRA